MYIILFFNYLSEDRYIYILVNIVYTILPFRGWLEMNGCCEGPSCSGGRSFLTREEKIEMLKDYKEELEKEVQGISERIKEFEKVK